MKNKINNQMKGHKSLIIAAILTGLFIIITVPTVMAHCPLCTGVTIAGVGVTRALGWDDAIIGVFVGGMIVSSALWINNILKKRNVGGHSLLRISGVILATFVLTILTFYFAGLFGPGNDYRIFGMEKITFGSISGSIVSLAAFVTSNKIKEKKGRVLFNYQTLVLTLVALLLNAVLFRVIF